MERDNIEGRLAFLREAERLKSVLRSAHTASGRAESTAEHSWRLCLMAMAFEDQLTGLDMLKLLKMCVIHDLGEAIGGDIPAPDKATCADKAQRERRDLQHLARTLDAPSSAALLALWDDYEHAQSPEAKAVKALDKLETILQHNQGINPVDFDYAFNLRYGKAYTDAVPVCAQIRQVLDRDTEARLAMSAMIRPERADDREVIARVTEAAFRDEVHSSHTEAFIVDALRRAGQLTVSLVAEQDGEVVGHVAVSPVTISSGATGWYGLGPVSVRPDLHGRGIGSALMQAALAELRRQGAAGCVVLGSPGYYGRFGFAAHPGLELPGVPHEYFQAVSLAAQPPAGTVAYHEAFEATS